MQLDSLKDLYENGRMMSPGTTFTYRNYTLKKAGAAGGAPDHSEYMLLNQNGVKVESYTIGAFDSYQAFKARVDELIDFDPDTMDEWLNRSR